MTYVRKKHQNDDKPPKRYDKKVKRPERLWALKIGRHLLQDFQFKSVVGSFSAENSTQQHKPDLYTGAESKD